MTKLILIPGASECNRDLYVDAIEALTLSNTPDVFGLHPNAEIGYYTHSAKDMWNHLVELQPQTGGESGGISREEFIGKIATDIQGKLPALFDVDRVRKSISEITPTYVVLLQELDRFNVLIKKMSTSLINLQRVSYHCNCIIVFHSRSYIIVRCETYKLILQRPGVTEVTSSNFSFSTFFVLSLLGLTC